LRKIIIILLGLLLLTECSVVRNRETSYKGISEENIRGREIEYVKSKNLCSGNYYIEKAEIEVITPQSKEKFLASIKFEYPEKYLISIKTRTGIEAARIFMSDDSVFVNDRINRKLYCGKSENLEVKYGISKEIFPVILGDFIINERSISKKGVCSEGKLNIDAIIKGLKIKYIIDCNKGKSISAKAENSFNNEQISFNYDNFYHSVNLLFPQKINIEYLGKENSIRIRIIKIESPWIGNIKFIPGNRYEILPLI
jgi:hypothetical protein